MGPTRKSDWPHVPIAARPSRGFADAAPRCRDCSRRGEVNGALLEDGTVLRVPPPEAERFTTLLQSGQTVVATGVELANPIGKVIEGRQIGSSREQLNQVQAPPGPGGKKGLRGPPAV